MPGYDDIDAAEAKAARLAADLAKNRTLSAADQVAVDAVVALNRRRQQAQKILDAEGPVSSNDKGVPIEHPAAKVERGASAEIRGWVGSRPDLFGVADNAGQETKKVGVFPGLKSV